MFLKQVPEYFTQNKHPQTALPVTKLLLKKETKHQGISECYQKAYKGLAPKNTGKEASSLNEVSSHSLLAMFKLLKIF